MMKRKWTALAAALAAVTSLAAGLSIAQDEKKETAVGKIMKKVGEENSAINAALRTPVAFKKASPKAIAAHADEMVKLFKAAREIKEPAESQKKSYADWTKFSDAMIKEAEAFAQAVPGGTQADLKQKFKSNVAAACTKCHNEFRVEEDEFK